MNEKVIIVTGGGQGIGKAIASRFIEEGFTIVIAEIDREAGIETEAELSTRGKILFLETDVAVESSVIKMVESTLKNFGKIDILINNAAIMINKHLTELAMGEWEHVIAVNLTGTFLCSKYASPHLKNTGGTIINIASSRAFMSEADTEAYSASKGGIVALTHSLAISLAPEVRVNCISPGWIDVSEWKKKSLRTSSKLRDIDHSQHPAGRVGKPEDIANLAFYLASPESSFITGVNFIVDGGMTRKMIYV